MDQLNFDREAGSRPGMSSYEDYTRTSKNYDRTREPVGTEVILGCLAMARTPLHRMTLLDAGCGTGNYSLALLPHVGKIEAVDLNPGMIEVAREKLSEGEVSFHNARIDDLPFDDGSLGGAMINQVLHHLPDDPSEGFPTHRAVIRDLARVIEAGGVLTVNTCSREQLENGYWYYHLIPEARAELTRRYVPLDELAEIMADSGFEYRGRFVPVDAVVQGEAYPDPSGPLRQEWRDGDSIWSLLSDEALRRTLSEVRRMDERDELEGFVSRHDAARQRVGQVSILYAIKR